jgi:diguanylate cyclase (GGDEF)-like protein
MTPKDGVGHSTNGARPIEDDGLDRAAVEETLAAAEQTLSAADQAGADRDQAGSDRDQRASDLEQAAADREHTEETDRYEAARATRLKATDERLKTAIQRARTTADRLGAAHERDVAARARDAAAAERDRAAEALEAASLASGANGSAERRVAALRARAVHDRARAAEDRAAAASDRETAADDRARAAIELRHAYHDDLTGALRREMGEVALQNEVDRARRADGRLVLAFVDVDELKSLNDRDGHPAGDALLKGVVATIRAKLRSFDPVVRYGGDEFICALADTDPDDAGRRFVEIQDELARDYDDARISVGVVELGPDETLDDLIVRGDAALYAAKGRAKH